MEVQKAACLKMFDSWWLSAGVKSSKESAECSLGDDATNQPQAFSLSLNYQTSKVFYPCRTRSIGLIEALKLSEQIEFEDRLPKSSPFK